MSTKPDPKRPLKPQDFIRKKYIFVSKDTIMHAGVKLTRIRAVIPIPTYNIKPGDLGGYIQSEENLAHTGEAWVGDDARVWGSAKISGNAGILGRSEVYDTAKIQDNTIVEGCSVINQAAKVLDNVRISGAVIVTGTAEVGDNVNLSGICWIGDAAKIGGCVLIGGNVVVGGTTILNAGEKLMGSQRVGIREKSFMHEED